MHERAANFLLPCFGVQVYLQFTSPIRASTLTGYALRGLLGKALFRQVCIYEAPRCNACALRTGCAYPQVFKPSEIHVDRLPAYVVHKWHVDRTGYGLRFQLILIGAAVSHLDTWLEALQVLSGAIELDQARGGRIIDIQYFDNRHGRPQVRSPKSLKPIALSLQPAARYRIVLETPLLTKHGRHDIFWAALRTRLRRLCTEYGSGDIAFDHVPWTIRDQRLIPQKLSLKNKARKITALTGELVVDEVSETGANTLALGSLVHAGADANCGMGRFRVEHLELF